MAASMLVVTRALPVAASGNNAALIVSLLSMGCPVAENVTEGLAKLQEKYSGRVPHEKVTGPMKPPCGVSVKVAAPALPKGMVRPVGFRTAVYPGAAMVSVSGKDVLGEYVPSPLYEAWMVKLPALGKLVGRLPAPLTRVAAPIAVDPLVKVTVPVGTPAVPETFAVKVTLEPVPAETAEAVSVVALGRRGVVTVME